MTAAEQSHRHHFAHAANFGRGLAAAIIFGLPLLMTMETWSLGYSLDGWSLLQFSLVDLVLLALLSSISGYDLSIGVIEDALDALAAFGMGAIASALSLLVFAQIGPSMPAADIAGMIVVQAIPGSFGAMIADKLFDVEKESALAEWRQSYAGQLFLMVAGALFLSFTLSPTEEIGLISYRMTAWHSLALMIATIALMHALIYAAGLPESRKEQGEGIISNLLRYTFVGYGVAVLTSCYILWVFGRLDGLSPPMIAQIVVLLAFPAGIGAAIARLVV